MLHHLTIAGVRVLTSSDPSVIQHYLAKYNLTVKYTRVTGTAKHSMCAPAGVHGSTNQHDRNNVSRLDLISLDDVSDQPDEVRNLGPITSEAAALNADLTLSDRELHRCDPTQMDSYQRTVLQQQHDRDEFIKSLRGFKGLANNLTPRLVRVSKS